MSSKLCFFLLLTVCIFQTTQALSEAETAPVLESPETEVYDFDRANSTKFPLAFITKSWTRNDCNGQVTYTAVTWPLADMSGAKTNCELMGANSGLATIETEAEFQFLRSKLPEMLSTRYNRFAFWLGGTDLYIHSARGIGQYWYYSGLPIDVSFWGPGEPNDNQWQTRGIETCVNIKLPSSSPQSGFMVNDEVCTTTTGYLCKTTTKPRKAAC